MNTKWTKYKTQLVYWQPDTLQTCLCEITLESVHGINQYYAIRVKFCAQGNFLLAWFYDL